MFLYNFLCLFFFGLVLRTFLRYSSSGDFSCVFRPFVVFLALGRFSLNLYVYFFRHWFCLFDMFFFRPFYFLFVAFV